jgi:hypothetical protein
VSSLSMIGWCLRGLVSSFMLRLVLERIYVLIIYNRLVHERIGVLICEIWVYVKMKNCKL